MRPSRRAISSRVAASRPRASVGLACGEEDAVAGVGPDRRDQAVAFGIGEVLGDRPAQRAVLGHRHVCQPFRAALLGPFLPRVEGPAGLSTAAGHHDRPHVRRLEHPERGLREVVGQFGEFEAEPQVGLVGPVAAHRLGVGHVRDLADLVSEHPLPQRPHDRLADLDDVLLLHEGHLDVELGELRLPVGPEVLVAVAPRDLEVLLQSGDHQQLLEQLRGLRQCVPVTRLQAHRHQEVAGTFGRRARQGRRLHLHEVPRRAARRARSG